VFPAPQLISKVNTETAREEAAYSPVSIRKALKHRRHGLLLISCVASLQEAILLCEVSQAVA
jgi:hypothetical protein